MSENSLAIRKFSDLANPTRFLALADRLLPWLSGLTALFFVAGVWLSFTTEGDYQQGETVRSKLSWFSTLTDRCLFVNQRGARTEERTLQQLARDIVRKQAQIITEDRESLIDRAWHAIVNTLKQFSGKTTVPQPAT